LIKKMTIFLIKFLIKNLIEISIDFLGSKKWPFFWSIFWSKIWSKKGQIFWSKIWSKFRSKNWSKNSSNFLIKNLIDFWISKNHRKSIPNRIDPRSLFDAIFAIDLEIDWMWSYHIDLVILSRVRIFDPRIRSSVR
jgi:hypothetical protein